MARGLGFMGAANVVVLAVYLRLSGILSLEPLREVIPLSIKRRQFVPVNLEAVGAAVRYCEQMRRDPGTAGRSTLLRDNSRYGGSSSTRGAPL
jgi:Pyruvate/2-oxoacid:ferredoxin oxidoreductase gamma subunit